MKLFLPINYNFFCITNKNNVKAILRRSKRCCTFSGATLPKRNLRGLEGLLAKRNQKGKYLLRLRTYCVQEGTEFSGVLRLRRLFVK